MMRLIMSRPWTIITLFLSLGVFMPMDSFAQGEVPWRFARPNGFNLSFTLVPREEILPGGPAKDGIPALTKPALLKADQASYLFAEDLLVGVFFNNEARAYPLRILAWHENVNDMVGGKHIAVTYCPLCNSAFVFDRLIGGTVREFGISGLLWNSNLLLYDRRSNWKEESLWSQVNMRAVTGPAAREGLRMTFLPSELTTWGEWRLKHPTTTVLSDSTGFRRNYGRQPYRSYFSTDRLMFPARLETARPKRFLFKEPMVLVQVRDKFKAYAVRDVAAAGEGGLLEDLVGERRLLLTYLPRGNTVRVEALDGPPEGVPVAYTFWFAISAMMPGAEIYEPPSSSPGSIGQQGSREVGGQKRTP
jgi:hypothetical protein